MSAVEQLINLVEQTSEQELPELVEKISLFFLIEQSSSTPYGEKKSTRKFDYSNLLEKIAEMHITQKELAKKIGVSESQLCKKLKSKYPFTQKEMIGIADALKIDRKKINDYFFTPA